MAAVATEARGRRPRAAKPRTAQRKLAGGIVWIVVVAALLAGVVALNVAVLRTNLALDELNRKGAKVRAENAALTSQLASSKTTARIQQTAGDELGVAPALPEQTTYFELPR
jgi:cell division protein FtsL